MISVLLDITPAKQSREIYKSSAKIWGDSVAVFQQIADVLNLISFMEDNHPDAIFPEPRCRSHNKVETSS